MFGRFCRFHDLISPGDAPRYGEQPPHCTGIASSAQEEFRPVVVRNCTRHCNLKCLHCYAGTDSWHSSEEMDTEAGKAFIRDPARYNVPVILFSEGEPLLRKELIFQVGLAKG